MAIEWVLDTANTVNGVRDRIIRVLLTDGNHAFRLVEVVMPLQVEPIDYIKTLDLETAWRGGKETTATAFLTAKARGFREYYQGILRAVDQPRTLRTLDFMVSAGLQAIDSRKDKSDEFAAWTTLLKLNGAESLEEKRALLLLIMQFATTGLLAGL